jgi:hypothetical protein
MDEIDRERRFAPTRRTRRNIVAGGLIAGAALLARMRLAKASPVAITGGAGGGQCFLKGTKIQTALGEQKVEDLAIGDLLPTVFGGMRPIQWVGRYRFRKRDPHKPWVKDALPVRVARSALAPNVPHSDLYLTKAHALFIDRTGYCRQLDQWINYRRLCGGGIR